MYLSFLFVKGTIFALRLITELLLELLTDLLRLEVADILTIGYECLPT